MPLRTSPGAILPADMNARQWSKYVGNQRVQYFRDGQTGYDTGTGFWLGLDDDRVVKFSLGNSSGNKITFDGTDLSIVANVILGSGYFIRSGQTAYDTGTGFWLGNDAGTPKFSIGNSASNKLTWDGTELTIDGDLNAGKGRYKAATTSRANTDVYADDPDLIMPLSAGAVYEIEMMLVPYQENSGPQIKMQMAYSGSGHFRNTAGFFNDPAASSFVTFGPTTAAGLLAQTVSYPPFSAPVLKATAVYETTTAGNFSIQWAQVVSHANYVRLTQGSFIRAIRLT